jgi:hypothetical protein
MNPNPLSAITFLIVPCGMTPLLQKNEKNTSKPSTLRPEPRRQRRLRPRVEAKDRPQQEVGSLKKRKPRRKSQGHLERELLELVGARSFSRHCYYDHCNRCAEQGKHPTGRIRRRRQPPPSSGGDTRPSPVTMGCWGGPGWIGIGRNRFVSLSSDAIGRDSDARVRYNK